MTDMKTVLASWASKMNEPVEKIEKEFSDLLASEVVKASSPTEEGRQTTALRFLIARHANTLIHAGGTAIPVTVLVINTSLPRKITVGQAKEVVEVSDVMSMVRVEETKETAPALITMWRDAAKIVNNLTPGRFYQTQLVVKNVKDLGDGRKFLRMACNSGAAWAPDLSRGDFDLKKVANYFKEAPYTEWGGLADSKDAADQLRMVRGTVMRAFKGESKTGRAFASMTVATDEMMMDPEVLTKLNGLTVYVEPSIMKYGEQSNLLIFGMFQRPQRDNTQVVLNAVGMVPVYSTPYIEQTPESSIPPTQSNPNIMGETTIPTGTAKAPAPPPADEMFK